jgi:GH15 family glucan-1,4-alpha-glucosidase
MEFIFERLRHKNPDGSIQIMYSIHGASSFPHLRYSDMNVVIVGTKDLEEIELSHLDGHKGSKPVRIGNGAADHIQLVCFSSKNLHESSD